MRFAGKCNEMRAGDGWILAQFEFGKRETRIAFDLVIAKLPGCGLHILKFAARTG